MRVNKFSLREIFDRTRTLEVPVFQRQYAWTQEHQWGPLWVNISDKFKDYLSKSNRPAHFLSAMVFDSVDPSFACVEKWQIIDGQQRLITMQIFISAFRDFCREQEFPRLAEECKKYTRNTGLGAEEGEGRFKVYPKKPDREQFEDIIFAESKAEIETRHSRRIKPTMIAAYLFFHSEISKFFNSDFFKNSEEAREESMQDRLVVCFHAIVQGLQVVTIELDTEDDPQVIYETLNALGEPLSFADMIRNDIFLRIGRAREGLYEKYWEPLEEKFPPARGKMDHFMHCYLTSQMGINISTERKRVYYAYKNWIGGTDSPFYSDVEEGLKVLSQFGAYFQYLIEPQRGNPFYEIAVFLKAFGIGAVYPFLLAVMGRQVDEKTQKRISTIIESYLIRRRICRQDTRGYNRLFVELTGKWRSGFSTDRIADQIAEFFLGKAGSSNEWPSDADFRKYWIDDPMDAIGPERLKYILKRLNESYMSDWSERITIDDGKLTIEHILPQQWIDNWPLPNGENGLSEEEISTATEKRNAALHTIGNLTILTRELNSSVSNGPWNVKKREILEHSILPINRYFQDIEEWNEEQIATRSEKLFQKALELWPRG